MTEPATPAFVIDGREYPFVSPDDLTIGEAMIVYDYSGLTLDQIQDKGAHPGLIAAYMHIAYARGNPDVSKAGVRELVEGSNLLEAFAHFTGEGDVGPPAPKPNGDEHEKPNGSEESSGEDSTNGSGEPASRLHRIGTPPSATSARSVSATSS